MVKTSSKLTVSLLATLFVGGSTTGSIFSSVLNEETTNSLGTAGAYFSTMSLPETLAAPVSVLAPANEDTDPVVAIAKLTPTLSPVLVDSATEIRTLTNEPDAYQLLKPLPEITLLPEPSVVPSPEVSVTPEPETTVVPEPEVSTTPEPEVSPTFVPIPEPTDVLPIEEPSSIEP